MLGLRLEILGLWLKTSRIEVRDVEIKVEGISSGQLQSPTQIYHQLCRQVHGPNKARATTCLYPQMTGVETKWIQVMMINVQRKQKPITWHGLTAESEQLRTVRIGVGGIQN